MSAATKVERTRITVASSDAEGAELAARLALDLDGVFEEVVVAYQSRIYGFALRLLANPADAEEIAQDAFVRAYRALQGYPVERIATLRLRPWLYQIAVNLARNRHRHRGRRPSELALVDENGRERAFPAGEGDDPMAALERAEGAAALAGTIAALPARYRAAVVLRHVEGLSYAEVAAVLDQPVGTAKANVHRGVTLLRAALAEPGR
ncbi:MAG: hypothetical protein AVDCRST_MAG73-2473 [uncultured Thermomicrobiales bacterium]|uniref:RNA polymerase sigma factor n=1 Tax=uncultured Thermomicrobiales bacterium TaxID=1645740 RepID=A0A6J4UCZ3_9BACT|nr:MAG: hypothetical protein AVDCRST_MAG73-2473 [uncultured Thermomicrobiales bacterium]